MLGSCSVGGAQGSGLALPRGQQKPHSPRLSQSSLWVLCPAPAACAPNVRLLSRRKRGRRGPAMAAEPAVSSILGFESVMVGLCRVKSGMIPKLCPVPQARKMAPDMFYCMKRRRRASVSCLAAASAEGRHLPLQVPLPLHLLNRGVGPGLSWETWAS